MSYKVRISTTDQIFEVNAEETILEAAMRMGIPMAHDCTLGNCSTCRVKLEEGSIGYDKFPMGITEEEHKLGYALACQAHPKGNVVVTPSRGRISLPNPVAAIAEVIEKESLTPQITRLSLLVDEDIDLDYMPGQHLYINYDSRSERCFSMTSAFAFGNIVDLYIKRIPNGWFTNNTLEHLHPGNKLNISLPHGEFYYRSEDWRPIVFIATGTGIAPVRSILESLLDDDDCPPVSLYWGMRTEQDLFLKEEFESWFDRLYEFNFVPVLSKPSTQWQGRNGYVQYALKEDLADASEYSFYICGSPEMVADVKKMIISLGGDPEYIYTDNFTYAAIEDKPSLDFHGISAT